MKRVLIFLLVPAMMAVASCGGNQPVQKDGQRLFVGDDIAVTETQYGKVQGYILDDVYTYLGIPYGAPTGGANRFMPPQQPERVDARTRRQKAPGAGVDARWRFRSRQQH